MLGKLEADQPDHLGSDLPPTSPYPPPLPPLPPLRPPLLATVRLTDGVTTKPSAL